MIGCSPHTAPVRLHGRPIRLSLLIAAVAALLAVSAPALAFNETGTVDPAETDCEICHAGDYSKGPHGGYVATSSKCDSCHAVHTAPGDSPKLLPGPTIQATCEACHDGTGGRGVYGVLAARGLPVSARHRIDVTNAVPGGDSSTGGTANRSFGGKFGYLTCNDCHSPHDSLTVTAFPGDRQRTATDSVEHTSNRLLRRRPTSSVTTVTEYGSDWCAGCHAGRTSASATVHNHPVDSLVSTTTPFYYNRVAVLAGDSTTTTVFGPVGRTNRAFIMPYPRTTQQGAHLPICQQCHEDKRSLGTSLAVNPFDVQSADGTRAADNPRFQVFPHESDNSAMLVETGADLCTNCHESGSQMP